MIHTIIINSAPFDTESKIAFEFCHSIISNKINNNKILMIFFYQDGVLIANNFIEAEPDLPTANDWLQFSKQNNIPLKICINAAARRGIVNEEMATKRNLSANNLCTGFELSGLSSLFAAISLSDKVISFG